MAYNDDRFQLGMKLVQEYFESFEKEKVNAKNESSNSIQKQSKRQPVYDNNRMQIAL